MNAYELATYLQAEAAIELNPKLQKAAIELVKQADRIAELEKEIKLWEEADVEPEFIAETIIELEKRGFIEKVHTNSKPYIWMDNIGTWLTDEEYHKLDESLQDDLTPLYTHPVKKLSDEEILGIYSKCCDLGNGGIIAVARAIIKEITE